MGFLKLEFCASLSQPPRDLVCVCFGTGTSPCSRGIADDAARCRYECQSSACDFICVLFFIHILRDLIFPG